MISVCLYLQIHHPYQIRSDYDFFKIGSDHQYEDKARTAKMVKNLAENSYLPLIIQLKRMIAFNQNKFKFSFSISGLALENLQEYAPEVITGFQELFATGNVEIIGEPYYHSLACIYSEKEFIEQVKLHRAAMKEVFGVKTTTFRNTEMIYSNGLAPILEALGFNTVLTQGTRRILGWRSPGFMYQPKTASKINMLLNYAPLTEHVQYYFSSRNWREFPITGDKFANWIHAHAGNGEVVGLFLDGETFGVNHHKDSGVFEFLEALPALILKKKDFCFQLPEQISKSHQPMAKLDVPHPISWGDKERDLSLWAGNHMQNATSEFLYSLETKVKRAKNKELLPIWRKLTSSDVFYQLHTKWDSENLPHKHFNHQNHFPFAEKAFIVISNMINDLEQQLQ
jgi:alpha-amylase